MSRLLARSLLVGLRLGLGLGPVGGRWLRGVCVLMMWFTDIAYLFAAIFYLPVLVYQMVLQGKNRRGWREKIFGPQARLRKGASRRIWIHGVSLGEINAARGLVEDLEARFPDCEIVISTTTDTGFARAVKLFGFERVFRYPLDFSWAVRRALRRIDPALIVLVELEVWPNLVSMAARRGVPVCIVNGRLTERSCKRLGWLGPITRRMFGVLAWIGVQDDATAKRFASVGAPADRIDVTGSVKWDTAAIADRIEGQDMLAAAVGIDTSKPLWVCGSTGVAEEAILIDIYDRLRSSFPNLQLAIVPRKPERFNEVASLIERRGFACLRRSRLPDGSQPPRACDGPVIVLGDTMGELRKFYGLATVVFVGRSLVPMGGSDPMEVAALGRPLVVGPHMDNFAAPTEVLEAEGALVIANDADAVFEEAARLLRHADIALEAGTAGQRTVRANQGATRRTVDALAALLDSTGQKEP